MADFDSKKLVIGVDKLSPNLNKMNNKFKEFHKNLSKSDFGKLNLKNAVTDLPFSSMFVKGMKDAMAFEEKMENIREVINFDTPEQFKEMGQDIREMSLRLPIASKDIASIVAQGSRANIPRDELIQFAQDAIKMGIAFETSAEEAGITMATWRTSLKLTQKEVVSLSDKINLLSNTQNVNAKDISDVVSRIGTLAAQSGVGADKLAALSSTIIATGTNTEQAATGLKNFMLTLTSGKAATAEQQKVLQRLGFTSTRIAKGMQKDAEGTIMKVLESLGNMSADKRTTALTMLFGKENVESLSPLLSNMDLLKTNFNRVGDAAQYAGSMQKKYDSSSNTTANKLQLFNNALTNISLSINDALLPAFTELLNELQPLVVEFGHFIQENPELVKMVAMAVIGLIGLRIACAGVNIIVGAVSNTLTIATGITKGYIWFTKALAIAKLKLKKAFDFARIGLIGFNTALKANPIGFAMSAIALAAGLIIEYWDEIVQFFKWLWGIIEPHVMPFINDFIEVFKDGAALIVNGWRIVSQFFSNLWSTIEPYVMKIINFFVEGLKAGASFIVNAWSVVSKFFSGLWEFIKPFVMPIIDAFIAGFKAGGEIIVKAWEAVSKFFSGLWETIKPCLMPIFDVFITPFEAAGDLIPKMWDSVKNFFKELWNNVKSGIEPLLNVWKFLFGDDKKNIKVNIDTSSLPQEVTKLMDNYPYYQTPQMPINKFSNTVGNGELVVKFENAPEGTIVKETKQASGFNMKTDVGWNPYANLGRG
ncbi:MULTISPECIES: phage tail tape measure protein [unclassified Gilliamella]|uniref:phage tail tape measure protein n=1 Tax=unclassified Gilliamella TaxID=2685620 RepID=UPI00226ABF12|nr:MULTISPECIES: phage tail tape measure protein [unclassified Gilliamella]MCX8582821.1 phage tail tape measure protein [Gilliamella sp. B3372]MCX8594092.1 phage tail tape measure protein [Gilliamella sp. B3367]